MNKIYMFAGLLLSFGVYGMQMPLSTEYYVDSYYAKHPLAHELKAVNFTIIKDFSKKIAKDLLLRAQYLAKESSETTVEELEDVAELLLYLCLARPGYAAQENKLLKQIEARKEQLKSLALSD